MWHYFVAQLPAAGHLLGNVTARQQAVILCSRNANKKSSFLLQRQNRHGGNDGTAQTWQRLVWGLEVRGIVFHFPTRTRDLSVLQCSQTVHGDKWASYSMSIGSSVQVVKWEWRELQNEWSYTPPFYVPSRCAQWKIPNEGISVEMQEWVVKVNSMQIYLHVLLIIWINRKQHFGTKLIFVLQICWRILLCFGTMESDV